ncbi:hypothetical protein L9F63_020980, partial [Diploptera punctata]
MLQVYEYIMDSLEEQLFAAVSRGDINYVNCLLAQAILSNVNIVCSSGRTPLGTAAEMGNMAILKILLDASNTVPAGLSENHFKQEQPSHHLKHRSKKNRRDYSISGSAKKHATACASKDKIQSKMLIGATCQENNADSLMKQFPISLNSDLSSDAAMKNLSNPSGQKQNLGYFIVVHKDRSRRNSVEDENVHRTVDENRNQGMNENPGVQSNENTACALNDVRTPDGMDGLEWDVEVEDKGRKSEGEEEEEDSWASLYRWYADILDRTSSLLQLPHKCDVNHQDVYGRCAVHYAAEQGHVDALCLLTAAGCRLDIGDSDNLTPLHLAAARDHYKVAKMLLDAGVEVNRKTSDKTSALHIAASRGFIDTVKVLLDGGANIDSLDASDRTPLLLAVSRCHQDVVSLLINHGAKVNIEEIHGYTPLCEAVWQKMVPLVQLLLNAGAKITQSHYLLHYAIMHRHIEMAELLLRAGSIVNLRDDNGDSPLIVAARTGISQLAELLLRNGAAVNFPNGLTGSTPLHEAVEYIRDSKFSTFESMFHVLRHYGAILNVHTCTGGDSPLFRAILLEKDKAASLLIRHGTDVNFCDVDACVVDNLCLARKRNNFTLARMIVYAGFDLQHSTPDLQPPSNPDALSLDNLRDWLTYMKFNPMRLTELCRLVIRGQLSERVYEKITSSHLPSPMNVNADLSIDNSSSKVRIGEPLDK